MKDIKEASDKTLRDDAVLQGMLDYTPEDPRIYYFYPPEEIELGDSKLAYITYYELVTPPPYLEREEELYCIDIWGREMGLNEDIFERVDALLNRKSLLFTDHYNLITYRELKRDLFEANRGLYHKVIHYRVVSIPKE